MNTEAKERDVLDLKPEVVTVDPKPQLPAVAQETASVLQAIERIALNPAANMDALAKMFDMQERILDRKARMAFNRDFIAMKPWLPVIERKGRIVIRDKNNATKIIQSTDFAKWEDIDEAITPVLQEYGFVLHFHTSATAEGKVIVTSVLKHVEGHEEENSLPPLPLDATGSKNNTQGVGSSLSYGKRYAAVMHLNIRTKGEDDDGKTSGAKTISEKQTDDLRALMTEVKASKDRFLEFFGVDSVEALPATRYDEAVQMLEAKRKPKNKAQEPQNKAQEPRR